MIRSMIIALSMYSKIPMPQFEWKEKDMKYTMCFFPFVGAIIGAFEWLWYLLCKNVAISEIAKVMVGLLIPLVITGGFHVDGYMDTMDAIHSYQPRERKLEILKDSHVGAFAVIMLVVYVLAYLAGLSCIVEEEYIIAFCFSFVVARILSGLSLMVFPKAKKDGILAEFAFSAEQKGVIIILGIELILSAVALVALCGILGMITVLVAAVTFLYYGAFSKKNFGGITGDIAGYFLCVCELAIVIALAVAQITSINM